ncbi:hypothetical protein KAJ27_25965, partial [bacterium]|nr:hypothetical protein [bacterium]
MELHEIIIKPCSGFATPLKGDTIFGHFCWQAAHDSSLLEGGLTNQIEKYSKTPYAVFSSAYPRSQNKNMPYFFKRPDIPMDNFMEDETMQKKDKIETGKKLKKKNWINTGSDLFINLNSEYLFSDKELTKKINKEESSRDFGKLAHSIVMTHNSLNRMTNSTGTGMFAPFETEIAFYHPETLLT